MPGAAWVVSGMTEDAVLFVVQQRELVRPAFVSLKLDRPQPQATQDDTSQTGK